MSMEQLLYAQVIMLLWWDLKFVWTDKIKNEDKFKFQGKSAISQRWFDLGFGWIEVNFSTREPDFYKKLFQSHDNKQDINTFKLFHKSSCFLVSLSYKLADDIDLVFLVVLLCLLFNFLKKTLIYARKLIYSMQ